MKQRNGTDAGSRMTLPFNSDYAVNRPHSPRRENSLVSAVNGYSRGIEGHPTVVMESSAGSDFETKFEVLNVIGRGGMGVVLRVRHRELDQFRAVKLVYQEALQGNPKALERFRQEAMIVSRLSHPNIVQAFDFDYTDLGAPYLVMEYLEGESLAQLIDRRRSLSLRQLLQMLTGVADALDKVHALGIVHRDLKPANLMLTTAGRLKILDFGISHVDQDVSITRAGEVIGTPLYMAPEQLTQHAVNRKADIYALASVVHELLLGRPVFEAEDPNTLRHLILNQAVTYTEYDRQLLPHHVIAALEKGLAKQPAKRFNTAWDLVVALAGKEYSSSITRWRQSYSSVQGDPGVVLEPEGKWYRPQLQNRKTLAAVWGFLGVVTAVLLVLASWERHQGEVVIDDRLPTIGVLDAVVEMDGEDKAWLEKAVAQLGGRYLSMDTRTRSIIPLDQLPPEPEIGAPSGRSDWLNSASSGHMLSHVVGFRLARRQNEYCIELSLYDARSGATIWQDQVSGSGFEQALETVTWRLYRAVQTKRRWSDWLFGVKGDCAGDHDTCEWAKMAEHAFSQGLFSRIDRLKPVLLANPQHAFVSVALDYLRCNVTGAPGSCRFNPHATPLLLEPDSDRERLSLALSSTGQNGQVVKRELCKMVDSPDQLVRNVARVVGRELSCLDETDGICSRFDSFFDRLSCVAESERDDDAKTAARYLDEACQLEIGHQMVLSVVSSVPARRSLENATSWLRRSALRHGQKSPAVARSMFRYHMILGHGTDALIWARRSARPLRRESLALQLDGWLRGGVERSAMWLRQRYAVSRTENSDRFVYDVRNSIQPIVLTGSSELAAVWLNALGPTSRYKGILAQAIAFVRAIEAADRDGCESYRDPGHPLTLEGLYYCGWFDQIVLHSRHRRSPEYVHRVGAFLVADAHLHSGRLRTAEQAFVDLIADPLVRIENPVASILGLERLARLAREQRDENLSRTYYNAFLESWSGLDVPLVEHISALEFVSANRR